MSRRSFPRRCSRRRAGGGPERGTTALAVLAVLLAGCGGSTPAKEGVQARRAISREALLIRSDLPAGWSAAAREPENEPKLERLLAECLHVPPAMLDEGPAEVRSPGFRRGRSEEISNTVSVAESSAQAESAF